MIVICYQWRILRIVFLLDGVIKGYLLVRIRLLWRKGGRRVKTRDRDHIVFKNAYSRPAKWLQDARKVLKLWLLAQKPF